MLINCKFYVIGQVFTSRTDEWTCLKFLGVGQKWRSSKNIDIVVGYTKISFWIVK